MAAFTIPLPPRYPDSSFSTAKYQYDRQTVQAIEKYVLMARLLLPTLQEAVTNKTMTVDESKELKNAVWAFLDTLTWHISIPFKHMLMDMDTTKGPAEDAAWLKGLQDDLVNFKNLVRIAGLAYGDDPFTRPGSITSNIPAQHMAELHIHILLLKRGIKTMGKSSPFQLVPTISGYVQRD